MPQHSETRSLPFCADQMFDLVADITLYPEFLPWCSGARIKSRAPHDMGEILTADLIVSFKVFREKFGSRVLNDKCNKRIETEFTDGPFSHLQSCWSFAPTATGCDVTFDIDFEFRNPILRGVSGLFFLEAMQKIVRAFEARAQALYDDKS